MDEKRIRFKKLFPNKFFASNESSGDLVSMTAYLQSIDFLNSGEEVISTEIPGAGNMNYVIRVKTDSRTFILKQSRPWVEKYPSIDAPIERIEIEAEYYRRLNGKPELEGHSPEIYKVDLDNFVILMEDLGNVEDYTNLYASGSVIDEKDVKLLAQYLKALHTIESDTYPANLEMRKLNHEHIFNYPFVSDNGFNLDDVQDGLSKLSINEKTDQELVKIIRADGERYLAKTGGALLHGDFYPGSWMKSNKLYIIDAEFSFAGPVEFDLGVYIAHMKMTEQSEDKIDLFLSVYGNDNHFDSKLTYRFAGIEILRRFLGVAQLPVSHSVEYKAELIALAKEWILK